MNTKTNNRRNKILSYESLKHASMHWVYEDRIKTEDNIYYGMSKWCQKKE